MKPKNFPGRVEVRRARARGVMREQEDMRMRVGARYRNDIGDIIQTPPGFPKTFVERAGFVKRTTLASKVCPRCFARFLSSNARQEHEIGCEK